MYHGEITVQDAVQLAEEEIAAVFREPVNDPTSPECSGFAGDSVGICPFCGSEVKRGKFRYYCTNKEKKCALKIPTVLCGRSITPPEAAKLLTEGKTEELTGFTSKAGKQFSAALKLEEDNVAFVFREKGNS